MAKVVREIAAVPSGHVGVYRANDGKRWEAYVMLRRGLVRLGVYRTIREAVAARANYWKAHEREPAAVAVLKKIQRRVGKKLPSRATGF